jgi:SAM-dependent methyltransferase
MQNEKTIEFWNDYHERDDDKEWILKPSEQLLDRILSIISDTSCPKVLEIGCGTSQLARWLYERKRSDSSTFVVTDVSPVCIQINQSRDAAILSDRFEYQVLNALEPADPSLCQKFDVVLDKGCLDTFLYRSSKGSQLVPKLLGNVCNWLSDRGQYLVLTPRPRIPMLRDYPSFSSVRRVMLDDSTATLGDLDGGTTKQVVYLHVCTKRHSDIPTTCENTTEVILQQCGACGMTFQEFQTIDTHVKIVRRWKGHLVHCRDSHKKVISV